MTHFALFDNDRELMSFLWNCYNTMIFRFDLTITDCRKINLFCVIFLAL